MRGKKGREIAGMKKGVKKKSVRRGGMREGDDEDGKTKQQKGWWEGWGDCERKMRGQAEVDKGERACLHWRVVVLAGCWGGGGGAIGKE